MGFISLLYTIFTAVRSLINSTRTFDFRLIPVSFPQSENPIAQVSHIIDKYNFNQRNEIRLRNIFKINLSDCLEKNNLIQILKCFFEKKIFSFEISVL